MSDEYNMQCQYCGIIDDYCSFSDTISPDRDTSEEQLELLHELWQLGYNLVDCPICGKVNIIKIGDTE